jgi:hypothetical protein
LPGPWWLDIKKKGEEVVARVGEKRVREKI